MLIDWIHCRQEVNYGLQHILRRDSVAYSRKKQPVVAQFITEAEFRAMAHMICKLLWLKIILLDKMWE